MPTPIPEILRVSVITLKSQPTISGTRISNAVESIEINTGVGSAGIDLMLGVGVGVGVAVLIGVGVGVGAGLEESGFLNSLKLQDEM